MHVSSHENLNILVWNQPEFNKLQERSIVASFALTSVPAGTVFTGTPFPYKNIYGNAVPTCSRTTTPLLVRAIGLRRRHYSDGINVLADS